jgi:hypothetical protein
VTSAEKWRPVKGWEGLYDVSSAGRVRNAKTKRVRKLSDHTSGYKSVKLKHDGAGLNFYIHRLVARAFIGPAGGKEVNHKDFDKTNNTLENLEWVKRSKNMRHARDHTKMSSKINAAVAKTIRQRVLEGELQRVVGKEYGINQQSVSNILRGKTWQKA